MRLHHSFLKNNKGSKMVLGITFIEYKLLWKNGSSKEGRTLDELFSKASLYTHRFPANNRGVVGTKLKCSESVDSAPLAVPLSPRSTVLKNTRKLCRFDGITPNLSIIVAGVKTWLKLRLFVYRNRLRMQLKLLVDGNSRKIILIILSPVYLTTMSC